MRRRGALTPYLFLLPGLTLFAAFRLYPLLDGLRLSFTNARLGRGNTIEWSTPEQQWTADYVNVRDDRVEVFGALESGAREETLSMAAWMFSVLSPTAGHTVSFTGTVGIATPPLPYPATPRKTLTPAILWR